MIYDIQNKDDLDKEIDEAGDKLIVIDFYANWCGPCKIISPKLEELSLQYADKAKVLKVNVDDCEEIAMEYNVSSMPTFIFMKDHQVIDVFVGGNAEKLSKNMEKYLGDGEPNPVFTTLEDGEDIEFIIEAEDDEVDGVEVDDFQEVHVENENSDNYEPEN